MCIPADWALGFCDFSADAGPVSEPALQAELSHVTVVLGHMCLSPPVPGQLQVQSLHLMAMGPDTVDT